MTATKPSASEARGAVAAASAKVIAALGAVAGINGASDVTTDSLNISPQYVWNSNTQANDVRGYSGTQGITVRGSGWWVMGAR